MRPSLTWGVLLAVSLAATAALWQQQQRLQLERESLARRPASLAPQAESVPPPEPEGERWRAHVREFDELTVERDRLRALLRPEAPAPLPRPQPVEPWRNAGRNTPRDTIHTAVWAALNGEIGHLRATLLLDADAQAAAEELFAALPANERSEFGDPATVVAVMMSGRMPLDLRPPVILDQRYPDPRTVGLRLLTQRGHRPPEEKTYHLTHDGTGWRIHVPASLIQTYRRMLLPP